MIPDGLKVHLNMQIILTHFFPVPVKAHRLTLSFYNCSIENNGRAPSQHHPSNWIDADEDDDEGDDSELCVQSTPPYS